MAKIVGKVTARPESFIDLDFVVKHGELRETGDITWGLSVRVLLVEGDLSSGLTPGTLFFVPNVTPEQIFRKPLL